MKTRGWIAGVTSAALVGAACAGSAKPSAFDTPGAGADDGGTPSADPATGGDGSAPPKLGDVPDTGAGKGGCLLTDPNVDADHDGWTPNQGDCNDCDPNVNPGAIDVLAQGDGGPPAWGDEDCDGTPGDSAQLCDQGLALDDVSADSAAKSIELCARAGASDRKYGVLSAAYVRADGTALASPGLQAGIEPAFGTNVHTQAGQSMLVLSTGYARTAGQTGACGKWSCQTNASGKAPAGFPQNDPACPHTDAIVDDVALEVKIRVPTNATGYSFNFKFYSFEFPDWVCESHGYNDQFIALATPAPAGAYPPNAASGNISFDSNNHPVSVNLGFFDVCDPTTPARFATHCKAGSGTCPALPSPYCPLGVADLQGTGFDTWHASVGPAGATRWLQTNAPVQPGSVMTIRFAIWDAFNTQFDSTVLIDDFHWIATGGTIAVGTAPVPVPK